MLKPRNPEGRSVRQPLGSDVFRSTPRAPAPRLRDKDPHNPPIVTVLGAGIAGLTAAHELAERGFLVQVIESARDPYERRALVGGMAATQSARVRANIEDLHPKFFTAPRPEGGEADAEQESVTQWLLRLFLNNRSHWIQTETPRPVHSILYSLPGDLVPPAGGRPEEPIYNRVDYLLGEARKAYRDRWIWDLVVRLPLLEADDPQVLLEPDPALLADYETLRKLADEKGTLALAHEIAKRGLAGPGLAAEVIDRHSVDIEGALEREFLCFRLRPYAAEGVDDGAARARTVLQEWRTFFEQNSQTLKRCVWPFAGNVADEPVPSVRLPRTLQGDLGLGGGRVKGWIEVEIAEQRLPGEHGFRFFPAYYRHIDDTMKRIPLLVEGSPTSRTVFHNLRPTRIQGIGLSRRDLIHANVPIEADETSRIVLVERSAATSIEGFRDRTDRFMKRFGGTPRDGALFFAKLVRFMTSCAERREQQYEKLSWSKFIGLGPAEQTIEGLMTSYSQPMRDQLEASAQALLAFTAAEADARTYGNTAVQLLLDSITERTETDRTLNGPTSDAWLEPWREYLELQGVRFFRAELDGLERVGDELVPKFKDPEPPVSQDGFRLLTHEQGDPGRQPDFYVMALDFKRAAELLEPHAPDDHTHDFKRCVEFYGKSADAMKDMTGVQFFFDAKMRLGEGHLYYPYSEWGLSSISQSEFWAKRNGFADGFRGVLSVDVANTTKPRGTTMTFSDVLCGPQKTGDAHLRRWRAAAEVWRQIEPRIAVLDSSKVPAAQHLSYPRCFHVDRSVKAGDKDERGEDITAQNYITSKYLAAMPDRWALRPGLIERLNPDERGRDAYGRLFERENREIRYGLYFDRWVLCGTYMATRTRITTMESANESARHAVITILDALETASGDSARPLRKAEPAEPRKYNGAMRQRRYDRPEIWNPEAHELPDLAPLRRLDARLVAAGLPHFLDIIDFDRHFALALYSAEFREQSAKTSATRTAAPGGGGPPLANYADLVLHTLQSAVCETLGSDQFDIRGIVHDFLEQLKK